MAGRAHSRTLRELEAIRVAEARALPTHQRTEPATYSPDLCAEIIQLADIGLAPAEIASHWAVSEEEVKAWEEAHPDFNAAAQRARTRAKGWWQRQPRLAIAEGNNKFPAGAWAQQVRALFPEYDDKAPAFVLNLAGLVVLARPEPEPLGERTVDGSNPLIAHETGQLAASYTASGDHGMDALPAGGPGSADPIEGDQ